MNDLAELRAGIDECDAQLVALLAKRNGITEKIGAIKQQTGLHYMRQIAKPICWQLVAKRQSSQGVNPELLKISCVV